MSGGLSRTVGSSIRIEGEELGGVVGSGVGGGVGGGVGLSVGFSIGTGVGGGVGGRKPNPECPIKLLNWNLPLQRHIES